MFWLFDNIAPRSIWEYSIICFLRGNGSVFASLVFMEVLLNIATSSKTQLHLILAYFYFKLMSIDI